MQRLEPDAALAQLADDVDQVLQALAEPPQFEDPDGVTWTGQSRHFVSSGRSVFLPLSFSSKIR
ncbi:hypothetical protein [Kribbella sp. VKM Ac-2568]|uniref:hypothetical protein n=1 Tax=Kribbella sp. VKM Ac-2568 TaxID=2512219 RepID=UPI0010D7ABCB|nr:hypothetical protein [Kribbella sp. VKM Ac-2568]TCM46902.1 hypothetical protein EV648_105380 [Kribbella sp. VKM Ac-2568]